MRDAIVLYLAIGVAFESLLYTEFEDRGVLVFINGVLAWPVQLLRWYIDFFRT